MFSIIIPTYNSEKTIHRAIKSCINQSFKDFEVIVIDNLSTDNTINLITSFDDKRISVFSQADIGIYDAMNKGILKSAGEWLLFLGSDDQLFNSNTLALVWETILKAPRSKLIYGDVMKSDGTLRSYSNYNYIKLLRTCICHQSIYYHKSLFINIKYDTNYKICADWDFNLKVFRKKNHPTYINTPLSIFNLSGISSNWSKHPEYLQNFANNKTAAIRYRGYIYIAYYYFYRLIEALKNNR
ncbi:glycosyl transferase family 2 [Pseudopedobacter saltans DSM 12145]|uniref:Glycosyl transferase family 2 n=1 Tax=Pseudopedobacter saltans (strain ATCC 51119 / DSM 12145 / JCM 21818 / CCUG 39354 / LMG 10337 / NBRC 100064 / NCIMB 13643) TaxID=762903 RepID=F0SD81_PSESL|nr:glycosyltransferase family 2 protein [Pseudopedobacter saltans]ADY52867.1 glycosyl transferase family 2 [Pseudopedobacter saltans DSM 12145]